MKLRVILEKVRILDEDEFRKVYGGEAPERGPHRGDEVELDVRVRSGDDGDDGSEQHTRLPREGFYHLVTGWSINVRETVFEGEVGDHLRIQIDAVRPGSDPPEKIASYSRELSGDSDALVGSYEPDGLSGREHLDYWQVYYRVEEA